MTDDPRAPSQDELMLAVATAQAFWLALAAGTDDDDELPGLLTAGALNYLGAGDGLAERIRHHLGISFEECGRVGVLSTMSILPDHELRLSYVLTPPEHPPAELIPYAAGHMMDGWRIELVLDEGRWLVDPIRAHDAAAIGTAEIRLD